MATSKGDSSKSTKKSDSKAKSSKIEITEHKDTSDEFEVIETKNTKIERAPQKIQITHYDEVVDAPEQEPELEVEAEPEDGEQWHKFEEDDTEESEHPEWDQEQWAETGEEAAPETEPNAIEVENDEDVERPEWDEEKWQQSAIEEDDTEESEHPEWDQEQWTETADEAKKKTESEKSEVEADEDVERPEWDEEKWQQARVEGEKAEAEKPVANNQPERDDKPISRFAKFKRAIAAWWHNPKQRNLSLAGMSVVLFLLFAVPITRYAILNTTGVRASASMTVLDQETGLPLKNVEVTLADTMLMTNEKGYVVFDRIKLGSQELTIRKSAYIEHTKFITIGMGSNQLGNVELTSNGSRVNIKIVDWLSGMPIPDAEVSYNDNGAYANAEGIASMAITTDNPPDIEVTVLAPGYTEEVVSVSTTSTDVFEVQLVLAREHYFVTKRSGTYDVYRAAADGSGAALVVEGTGTERDDIRFDVSPSGSYAILVATRDASRKNADGYILSGVYRLDLATNQLMKIDESERVDLVGWLGDNAIYIKVQAGASGTNPERHRLVSYDLAANQAFEIAASNYFNDILVAQDYIFYAPSDAYKENPQAFLYRANKDGSRIDIVMQRNVWTIVRTGYNTIAFDSKQQWFEGEVAEIRNTELDSPPANVVSRLYTDNPSGTKSAWVDIRDGKGSLILHDVATGDETTLWSQGGLRSPIVWLSDSHILFRIVNDGETADYVMHTDGSEPRKITDVTDVSGVDRWYYYY